MTRIQVSDKHQDHYLRLEAADGDTSIWWDGFTGLKVVIHSPGDPQVRMALNASHLVSVVDRACHQTFAWAFPGNATVEYVHSKIPGKVFSRYWKQRLAESIALALRLHGEVVGDGALATAGRS